MSISHTTTTPKIITELQDFTKNYEGQEIEKIDGLRRSQYKVIRMCEFYSDSKYMGAYLGNRKKVGKGYIDVPFFNIVNFRVALARTATDIDIADIQVSSDNPETHAVQSMILNREAYEWMKEAGFSKTLNEMGAKRPKYGGYLVKKCYDDDDPSLMKIDVLSWTNVYTNQLDIMDGPIIERHPMCAADLAEKEGVWDKDMIRETLVAARKAKSDINVFEITGDLPASFMKDAEGMQETEDDEYTYSLQKYFISEVDGKYRVLYFETLEGELEDYYEYLSWEENGYGLGRGVIEDSEEAQVWTNDAVVNESIAMTLAGRVGIKTTSKKVGNNVLEHDHGKIYEMEDGADIGAFNLAPSALGHYQTQIGKWNEQANNVASSYNSLTGEQPTSGTPYSQTLLLNQVASKPFDYKREEWGIHLTKLFEKWVIPHLIERINKKHILISEFTDEELIAIDQSFANKNANDYLKQELLNGNVVQPAQHDVNRMALLQHIKGQGKKRFLAVPKGYFNGIVPKVTVLTTGEQKNKAAIMTSLSNILEVAIKSFNPQTGQFGVVTDPVLVPIFKRIVEIAGAGVSPVSLGQGVRPSDISTAAAKPLTPDQTASAVGAPVTPQMPSPPLASVAAAQNG